MEVSIENYHPGFSGIKNLEQLCSRFFYVLYDLIDQSFRSGNALALIQIACLYLFLSDKFERIVDFTVVSEGIS